MRSLLVLAWACLLLGCGAEPTEVSGWQTCTLKGIEKAGGLAIYEEELVLVAGGNDRNVYAVPRATLTDGGTSPARGLIVDVKDDAFLAGAERFSEQGYQLHHLWALPLDFQAVAVRSPNFVFIGDRTRRVVFWGRLVRDAAGRLARARLDRVFVAPGATRSKAAAGDWRDQGPGLSGLVAPPGRRTEDLFVVDRGEIGGRFVRARKTDMYGSILGGVLLQVDPEVPPEIEGLSYTGSDLVLHRGLGMGETVHYQEVSGAAAWTRRIAAEGPPLETGVAWSGVAHAPDGTVYLVSNGSPTVVAWRRPSTTGGTR